MPENSFNITLNCTTNVKDPSLSIPEILEDFEKELSHNLDLENDWEVGIKEISLMRSWYLLPIEQKIELIHYDRNQPGLYSIISSDEAIIGKHDYTIRELIDLINEKIRNYFTISRDKSQGVKLKQNKDLEITNIPKLYYYEDKKNRIFMNPGIINENEKFFVRFEPYLSNLLGFQADYLHDKIISLFKSYERIEKTEKLTKIEPNDSLVSFSLNPLDKNIIKTLYIFMDLVESSYFNNNLQQFIQFVNIPHDTKFGDQIFHHYENPSYYKLKKKSFKNINIHMFDNVRFNHKFSLIPYLCGDLIITFNFRKVPHYIESLNQGENDNYKKPVEIPPQSIINDLNNEELNKSDSSKSNNENINSEINPSNGNKIVEVVKVNNKENEDNDAHLFSHRVSERKSNELIIHLKE